MWSKQVIVMALLGLFLMSMGVWMHNFGFLFAGMFIIAFIVITKVFFSPRASRLNKVTAEREMPRHRVMEDDILPMEVKTTAHEGTNLVEVYEELPYYSDIYEGSNDFFYTYTPEEKRTYKYKLLTPMRGHFEMGPTKARHSDFSFLFSQEEEILPKEDLFVYPEVLDIDRMDIMSKSLRHYAGPYLANQPGTSNEFFAIREYTRNDPYNKINWKAYAKTRKLMVNEFEKENICDAIILVDTRLNTGIGSITNNPLKYQIKAAISVAEVLLTSRNRVSMVTYGDGCELIPPGYGYTHLELFKTVLSRTQPRGTTPLWNAVYQATPYLYKKTTVIIVSSLDLDPTTVNSIRILFERGFDVRMLIIPSTPFENQAIGFKTSKNWVCDIEHQNNLYYLKEAGAKVYDWDLLEPMDSVMMRMNLQQKLLRGVFV